MQLEKAASGRYEGAGIAALPVARRRSRAKGHMVDAWAQTGEEGRGKLRKAAGRCTQPFIRRYPNGVTQPR
jgi:hypothetical protein